MSLISLLALLVSVQAGGEVLPDDQYVLEPPCLTKGSGLSQRGRALPDARLARPPRPLDVLHYDLALTVNDSNARISGRVAARLAPTQPLQSVVLDFQKAIAANEGMLTDAVRVDGVPRSFVHDGDSLVIDLPATVTSADTLDVEVDFHGDPVRGYSVGFGLARRFFRLPDGGVDFSRPMMASLSEPISARYWWPCHDHPFDAATVRLTVTGPATWTLAAPGLREEDVLISPEQRRQTFFMPREIPSYLVSLVISDLEFWTDSVAAKELLPDGTEVDRTVPLEYYAPTTLRADCEYTWANTKSMMSFMESFFGPYPYADIKYGMALFSFGGAMEHPTLSSMGDITVSRTDSGIYPGPVGELVVLHELAHMWFGDALRVARWGDIWLNEGFARYMEVLWLEEHYGPEFGRAWLERIRFDSYDGPLRDPNSLFSGTTYNKGAWVLYMLRRVMGRDALHQAMRAYVTDPALRFGPVTIEDFQGHCEEVYGANLDWFFDPWMNWEGRPRLLFEWSPTASGANLRVRQPAERVYRLPLEVRLVYADASTEDRIVWIGEDGATTETSLAAPREVADVLVDPDRNWLLDVDVDVPRVVRLLGVRPNPLNPSTTISFVVREEADVRIEIYDARGRRVRRLVDERLSPDVHHRDWLGEDDAAEGVASGIYFVRIEGPDGAETRKIAVVQ